MKQFNHVNAASFEEAGRMLKDSKGAAQAMAGGSDLLGVYKDGILKTYPETVINLKKIPGFDVLEAQEDCLKIGAGCRLNRIAEEQAVKEACPALAEAAYSVASPLIRSIGTIGGNICQDVRCWYYRYPTVSAREERPVMPLTVRTVTIPCSAAWTATVRRVQGHARQGRMCRGTWKGSGKGTGTGRPGSSCAIIPCQ